MIRYLDTAAALKLIVDEPESDALARDLSAGAQRGDTLVAALLLYTELHCAARRRGIDNPETVSALLDAVTLIDVSRDDFLRAGASSWGLRSADSLHLATALRLDVDEFITYDTELITAARRVGLQVSSPT